MITRGLQYQDLFLNKNQEQNHSKVPFQNQIVPNTWAIGAPCQSPSRFPNYCSFGWAVSQSSKENYNSTRNVKPTFCSLSQFVCFLVEMWLKLQKIYEVLALVCLFPWWNVTWTTGNISGPWACLFVFLVKCDLNCREYKRSLGLFGFFVGESYTRAEKHSGGADDKTSGQASGRMWPAGRYQVRLQKMLPKFLWGPVFGRTFELQNSGTDDGISSLDFLLLGC